MQRLTLPSTLGLALTVLALGPALDGPGVPAPSGRRATADELEILSYLSVARIEHGADPAHPGFTAVRVTGIDVQLVNDLGATNGNPGAPGSTAGVVTNGLGNLLIGYGAAPTGSHNVVLGDGNAADSVGALVAGRRNRAAAPYASVLGGRDADALEEDVVIVGGENGLATFDPGCVVVGGVDGTAAAEGSVAVGGRQNLAGGHRSVVVGGLRNTTTGFGSDAFVAGGQDARVNADGAASLGGFDSWVNSDLGLVGGGSGNQVTALGMGTVLGGLGNVASGNYSVVVGGNTNEASGLCSTVIGGLDNLARGRGAVVGGGRENIAGVENECGNIFSVEVWAGCDSGNTVSGGRGNRVWETILNPVSGYQTISGGLDRSLTGFDPCIAPFEIYWRGGGSWACEFGNP